MQFSSKIVKFYACTEIDTIKKAPGGDIREIKLFMQNGYSLPSPAYLFARNEALHFLRARAVR